MKRSYRHFTIYIVRPTLLLPIQILSYYLSLFVILFEWPPATAIIKGLTLISRISCLANNRSSRRPIGSVLGLRGSCALLRQPCNKAAGETSKTSACSARSNVLSRKDSNLRINRRLTRSDLRYKVIEPFT